MLCRGRQTVRKERQTEKNIERHNCIISRGVAEDRLAKTEDAYRNRQSNCVLSKRKPKLRQSKLEKDRLYIVNIIKT